MSNSSIPRRCPMTNRPLPPCYIDLFTDEARDDPNHPHHHVFTPPPPFQMEHTVDRYSIGGHKPTFLTTTRGPIERPLYKVNSIGMPDVSQKPSTMMTISSTTSLSTTPSSTTPSSTTPSSTTMSNIDLPTDDYFSDNNTVIKFHPNAMHYKAEMIRFSRMLSTEFLSLLQTISSPQPPPQYHTGDDLNTPFQPHLAMIDDLFNNLNNIISLLREHQAREDLLNFIKAQTKLNQNKTKMLNSLSDTIITAMKSPQKVSYDEIAMISATIHEKINNSNNNDDDDDDEKKK